MSIKDLEFEIKTMKELRDVLEQITDKLREAQNKAFNLPATTRWVYYETWTLWQYTNYTLSKVRETLSLLEEEYAEVLNSG